MKISIVTPSYNQAALLERTLQSVLESAEGCGAELEYIVIDGGSTDNSPAIIEQYASRLAWWCSEPDEGQYDAINKGFARATGDIMAWLNSSDLYFPWTLHTVVEIFQRYQDIDWITTLQKACIREGGAFESLVEVPGFSAAHFRLGRHGGPGNREFLQQETCFWRRSLWDKIGGKIGDSHRLAGDFWLWSEFFRHSRCTGVDAPLAAFRFHGEQRSTETGYEEEMKTILSQLQKEPETNFSRGYQNLVRQWIPAPDGISGHSEWKLDRHEDDQFLSIFRWWLQVSSRLKWAGSCATYLPLAAWKFARRGFRKVEQ